MAFKQATVNASDVPATLTNYPAYIAFSRVGITTLAEAQSVRVYADSGKVVEWAREVVSATEGHTKIPSLTSSTSVFVDYDGIRADYAVTDTYGRNAVWDGYMFVFHLGEAVNNTAGGYIDSTGNGNDGTGTSMALTEQTGIMGKAQDFDGVADKIDIGYTTSLTAFTLSCWFNAGSLSSSSDTAIVELEGGTYRPLVTIRTGTTEAYQAFFRSNTTSHTPMTTTSGQYTPGNWVKIAMTNSGTAQTLRQNATQIASSSISTGTYSSFDNAQIGRNTPADGLFFDGLIEEVRMRESAVSADWETTEYNNQSDETGFWGTWSTVSAGATDNAIFAFGGF